MTKNLSCWRLQGGSGGSVEAPGRLQGGSREAPGRRWEALGGSARVQTALGKLREAPGRLWEAVLGASWGDRRLCVGRLGDILEACEGIPGRPGAPDGNRSHSILRVIFSSILRCLQPCWSKTRFRLAVLPFCCSKTAIRHDCQLRLKYQLNANIKST